MSKEKNIDISVLIPAHGKATFLLEALESISMQKFPNKFEILLIDQKLSNLILQQVKAQKYANLRIISDAGFGLISALNLGLESAKYNWIARLDSDDIMHKSRIEKQCNAIKKDPKIILVGGQAQSIDAGNKLGAKIKYPRSNLAIKLTLKAVCPIPHPGVLVRKDLVLKAGGYSIKYPHVEDYELWCRLSKLGRFKNIKSTVLLYRTHPEQVTRKYQKEIHVNLAQVLCNNFSVIGKDKKHEMQFFVEIFWYLNKRHFFGVIKTLFSSKVKRKLKYQYIILRLTHKLILFIRI